MSDHQTETDQLGVCAPRCPRCGWQAIDRADDAEGRKAAQVDVVAHKAECPKRWTPTDHPPHEWPIGSPASWRDGLGCPTVCCKGEGSQRVDTPPGLRSGGETDG